MAGVLARLAKNHTGEPVHCVIYCEEFLAEEPVLVVATPQKADSNVLIVDSNRRLDLTSERIARLARSPLDGHFVEKK